MNQEENTQPSIEEEIVDKVLDAPRVTVEQIEHVIAREEYYRIENTTITFCVLHLQNGFTVTGESAFVSPENFDEEIGRKISRENAKEKIWVLEGYALKERQYQPNFEDKLDSIFNETKNKVAALENVKAYLMGYLDQKYGTAQ